MAQLAIFVVLKTKHGKRDDVMALWHENVRDRAAENPSESNYVYGFDMRDETIVTIMEVFESMEGFHQVSHSDWFKIYMTEVAQLLDGKPVYHMGVPQWIKPSGAMTGFSLGQGGPVPQSSSFVSKVVDMLPQTGTVKKIQKYLKSPLAIMVTLKSKPGQRDAIKALWEGRIRQRAAENPAETNYIYAYDMRDDTVIRIAEVFETMDAFHQIAHAKWFKGYMKEVTLLLDGKPEYHLATPQWIK